MQLENELFTDIYFFLYSITNQMLNCETSQCSHQPVQCSFIMFIPNSGGIYRFAHHIAILYYDFVCKQQQQWQQV